jgi:hypothetical protein
MITTDDMTTDLAGSPRSPRPSIAGRNVRSEPVPAPAVRSPRRTTSRAMNAGAALSASDTCGSSWPKCASAIASAATDATAYSPASTTPARSSRCEHQPRAGGAGARQTPRPVGPETGTSRGAARSVATDADKNWCDADHSGGVTRDLLPSALSAHPRVDGAVSCTRLLRTVLGAVVIHAIGLANRLAAEGTARRAGHRVLHQFQIAALLGAHQRFLGHVRRLCRQRDEQPRSRLTGRRGQLILDIVAC